MVKKRKKPGQEQFFLDLAGELGLNVEDVTPANTLEYCSKLPLSRVSYRLVISLSNLKLAPAMKASMLFALLKNTPANISQVANDVFRRVKKHNTRSQAAVRNSNSENPQADRKNFLDSPLDEDLVSMSSPAPAPAPNPAPALAPDPAQRTLRPKQKQTTIVHCHSCRPRVVYRNRFIKSNHRSTPNSLKQNLYRRSNKIKALQTTNKEQSLELDRLQVGIPRDPLVVTKRLQTKVEVSTGSYLPEAIAEGQYTNKSRSEAE